MKSRHLLGGLVNDRQPGQGVCVVDYASHHHESFRALNLAWITEYFVVEDADRKALDDPESNILRPPLSWRLAPSQ